MRRFFVLPENITGETVLLSGSEAHHIRSVLRLQPGELIELFDGTGTIYHAEIYTITGSTVEGRITGQYVEIIDNPFPMTLAQGILKGKKMDLVLQKATELGVDTLIPMLTRHCEQQKNLGHRMQRWQRIMLEACKQCGRTTPMQITPVLPLQDVPCKYFPYPILCWEKEEQALIRPEFFTVPGPTLLLIGPEGGFHKTEVDWARENGFQTLTLGPLILRAETAALAAVSIIQYLSSLQTARLKE